MVHRDDHGTGREEQQRLEERVGHQVEDGGAVRRSPERYRHVAELRQGRIRHDALDVVLHDAEQAHEKRRDGTDDDDHGQRRRRELVERRHARHHEDTGRHHRGGMDQRRDRGRAFHGVRQPDVQRRLRRLAHRADEQEDADQRHRIPGSARKDLDALRRDRLRLAEHGRVIERTREHDDGGDAEDETEIADAIHQERLEVGEDRRLALVPEADQKV